MNDGLEFFEERAAIMQFDAGLDRHTAEYGAAVLTNRYCAHKGISRPDLPLCYVAWLHDVSWSDDEGKPVYKWTPPR